MLEGGHYRSQDEHLSQQGEHHSSPGDRGQVEEVVVHLLECGQVVGGVDGEAVLAEEGLLCGEDVDHLLSAEQWDVVGLRALETLTSVC